MLFCPNFSNKQVKSEFDELVNILEELHPGKGEDAAYFIWNKTKGNGLVLGSDGAQSDLFTENLKLSNNDRKTALIYTMQDILDNDPNLTLSSRIPTSRYNFASANDNKRKELEEAAIEDYIKSINIILKERRWPNLRNPYRRQWADNEEEKVSLVYKHYSIGFRNDRDEHYIYAYYTDLDSTSLKRLNILLDKKGNKANSTLTVTWLSEENLDAILLFLMSNTRGKSQHLKDVISVIKQAIGNMRIGLEFVEGKSDQSAAKYDSFGHVITINTKAIHRNENHFRDPLAQTILHELIHAVTVDTILKSPELYELLEKLRKDVISKMGEDAKDYGLTDVYEFLAELSNLEFVDKLMNIDVNSNNVIGFIDRVIAIVNKLVNKIFSRVDRDHNNTAYQSAMHLFLHATFPEKFNIELQEHRIDDRILFESLSRSQMTEEQLSEEINKNFNILYKSYSRKTNKTFQEELLQNKIFETIGELQRTKDINSVRIALKMGLVTVGFLDKATRRPNKNDTVYGILYDQSLLPDPFSGLTPSDIVNMYRNTIGFYKRLIENVLPTINYPNLPADIVDDIQTLLSTITAVEDLWKQACSTVADKIVDDYIEQQVPLNLESKDNMKVVFKDWLHKNLYYGDIFSWLSFLMNYGQSENPIIKMAFHIIQDSDTKSLEEIDPISAEITRLFRKADRSNLLDPNWQEQFAEFDVDGRPTGYFSRDLNYGLYEKDLREFMIDLADRYDKKYGYHYIENDVGQIVNSVTHELAEDEEWHGAQPPVYIEWLLDIEDFKSKRSHRIFTFKYYKERLSQPYDEVDNPMGHGLSPKTLAIYQNIQRNINYYLYKNVDKETGIAHPELLNDEDKLKLDQWLLKLKDVSNPYNPDGTIKLSEDAKIGFEIQAWENFITEHVRTEIDLNLYQNEYNKVANENPQLLDDFVKYNTTFGINPNWLVAPNKSDDERTVRARLIKNSLRALVRKEDSIERDFSLIESYGMLNPQFWLDCKESDQILDDNKSTGKGKNKFLFSLQLYKDDSGNYYYENGNVIGTDKGDIQDSAIMTWYDFMVEKYTNIAKTHGYIPGLVDVNGNPIQLNGTDDLIIDAVREIFTYTRRYYDKQGNLIEEQTPLTIFSQAIPEKDVFINLKTGMEEPTLLFVPKGHFTKKTGTTYIDTEYDYTNRNVELPRREYVDEKGRHRYDTYKRYNAMHKGTTGQLYDILILTMENAFSDYESASTMFNYKLPLILAEDVAILSRIFKNGVVNTASDIFKSVGQIKSNDEDMRMNSQYVMGPDGSFAKDIPLAYTRPLDDPSIISLDVTSSVLLFAKMAVDYKNKTQTQSVLETLRYNLDSLNREPDAINDSNSEKMFDSMMNKHFYGNRWNDTQRPLGKWEVFFRKVGRNIARTESLQMLALNLLSMSVGCADSIRKTISESINGKYMDLRDLIASIGYVITKIPQMILNIGNPFANNKMTAMMRLNGIGKDYREVYSHMKYGRVRKIATSILMGGFSIIDYFMNCVLLRAHYNNVRFYDGDKIPKGFYTRYEMQQAFLNAGYSASRGKLAHLACTTTLWDMYEFKKGMAVLRENKFSSKGTNMSDYVDQRIKTQVRTKTLLRSALYNGMNPTNDIARYKENVFGVLFGAMRGWLTQQVQHLFAGMDDTSVRTFDEDVTENVKGSKIKQKFGVKKRSRTDEQRFNRLSWNFETGTPQDEIILGLIRGTYTLIKLLWNTVSLNFDKLKDVKFSYVEKYAWKDAIVFLTLQTALMFGYVPVREWALSNNNPPKTPEQASMLYSVENYINSGTYKLTAADVYFRTIEAGLAGVDVSTVYQMVNQLTVLSTGIAEHTGLLNLTIDYAGLSGNDLDAQVKRGSYKYYTNREKYLYKMIGPLDNIHTMFNYNHQMENLRFYENMYGGIYRSFGYDFKKKNVKNTTKPLGRQSVGRSAAGRSSVGRQSFGR